VQRIAQVQKAALVNTLCAEVSSGFDIRRDSHRRRSLLDYSRTICATVKLL